MDPSIKKLMDEYGLTKEQATKIAGDTALHMELYRSADRALGLETGLAFEKGLSKGAKDERKAASQGQSRGTIDQPAALSGKAVTPRESAAMAAPPVPESPDELYSTPEAIRYQVAPGMSGHSRDAVVGTLVNKHQVSPEGAVAYTQQMRQGADDNGVRSEAAEAVAARETRRLQLMKRYQDIKAAQQAGAEVSPDEAAWAAKVDARAQQLRTASIQSSARDAQAAQETSRFNEDFDQRRAQKQVAAYEDDERRQREVTTVSNWRPGMVISPDKQSLLIPIRGARQPNPTTVAGLMNSFGMDQGSATMLAMQLEGAQ